MFNSIDLNQAIYLIDVFSKIHDFFGIACLLLSSSTLLLTLFMIAGYIDNDTISFNKYKRLLKFSLPACIIFIILYIFIPSKETLYTMLVIDQVNLENYNFVKG